MTTSVIIITSVLIITHFIGIVIKYQEIKYFLIENDTNNITNNVHEHIAKLTTGDNTRRKPTINHLLINKLLLIRLIRIL